MKKTLLWTIFFVYCRGIHAQDLQTDLAQFDVELTMLSKQLPPEEPVKPFDPAKDVSRIDNLKTLYQNYLNVRTTPQWETRLNILKSFIHGFNPKEYEQLIEGYNKYVAVEANKITQPELQTIAAFDAWDNDQRGLCKLRALERIYKDDQLTLTKIPKIASEKLLNAHLEKLKTFDEALESAKDQLPTYEWCYPDLRPPNTPPTYDILKAWSTALHEAIDKRIIEVKGKKPPVIPVGITLKRDQYCKLPKETTIIVDKDGKDIYVYLGKTDISPYLDVQGTLQGIKQITTEHDVNPDTGTWEKTRKPFDVTKPTGQIPFNAWLKTVPALPADLQWCPAVP